MIECGSIDYAQARLLARHGQRPGAALWHQMATARGFVQVLELARHSSLQPWVTGITPASDAHQIEAVLRAQGRALVAETAGWMPAQWQAALQWCAVLPDLAALQHLARGEAAAAWMLEDPALRAVAEAPAAQRQTVLAAGPMAPLVAAWRTPANRPTHWGSLWLDEWRRRLPAGSAADDSLQALATCLQQHLQSSALAAPGPSGLLLQQLQERLVLLLRRASLQPAAVLAYLGLCALDLQRLRGELLSRLLFAPAAVPVPKPAAVLEA